MSTETPKVEQKPREPVPESETVRARLPHRLTTTQVRELLVDCPPVQRLRYLSMNRMAFITFASIEDAKKAIAKLNGYMWKVTPARSKTGTEIEWRVDVDFARPRKAPENKPEAPVVEETEVAALKLPLIVEENDVKQIFEGFNIVKIEMLPVRPKAQFRAAIVKFPDHAEQQRAIKEVNGTTVEESTIIVEARRIMTRGRRSAGAKKGGAKGAKKGGEGKTPKAGKAPKAPKKETEPRPPRKEAEPNESIFIKVPRFTTHEQIRDGLLKDFPEYKLYLRTRKATRPPVCFVTFNTVEIAKESLAKLD